MEILYRVHKGIYVNLTNRCSSACTFCLRQTMDHVGESHSLWLEREPTAQEVEDEFRKWDMSQFEEIVFCGFGEPTCALPVLLEVARWLKTWCSLPIRINTNGLADLIWHKPTAPMLKGLIDCVSVSLNAMDAEEYLKLTRSKFGIGSFDAMLKFTKECTQYVPHVMMTVVGEPVTTPEEQEICKGICEKVGATLRVRPYED